MTTYTSAPTVVDRPIEQVRERLSDFSRLQEQYDAADPELRARAGQMSFTPDSICINTPQMGNITLDVAERTDNRIVLKAASSPVPMALTINYEPKGDNQTEVVAGIEVEVPAMVRPFIGPKLQEAANQFGNLLSRLA